MRTFISGGPSAGRVTRAPLRPLAVLLILLTLAPLAGTASAQETLSLDDLEEPQKGVPDTVWRLLVTEEQANETRAVVFRNSLRQSFNLSIVASNGTTVFEDQGARGVRTLPGLPAGTYTMLIRFREGEFQVIGPAFGVNLNASTNGTIRGKADAYVVAVKSGFNLTVSGNVQAEWFDIRLTEPEHPSMPFTRTALPGSAYVLTLRGAEGTPYSIDLAPTTYVPPTATPDHSGHDEGIPGPGLLLVLLAALGAVVVRRR